MQHTPKSPDDCRHRVRVIPDIVICDLRCEFIDEILFAPSCEKLRVAESCPRGLGP